MTDMTLAQPNKTVGRVVLGPRLIGSKYVRIVAKADGSGAIELYDRTAGTWRDASGQCTFSDLWSAPAAADARQLALLKHDARRPDPLP